MPSALRRRGPASHAGFSKSARSHDGRRSTNRRALLTQRRRATDRWARRSGFDASPPGSNLCRLHLPGDPCIRLQVDDYAVLAVHVDHSGGQPVPVRSGVVLHGIALPIKAALGGVTGAADGRGRIPGRSRRRRRLLGQCAARRTAALRRIASLLGSLRPLEHLFHHGLHLRPRKDALRARTAGRVPVQHLRAELPQEVRIARGNRRRGPAADLLHEVRDAVCIEGHPQGAQLKKDAAHRPHVRGPGVRLLLADLRAEVVGGPDLRLGASRCAREDLRDAKVAHLQIPTLREEEVARLEITVQHVLVMDVLQR
mmetsp:Transcript_74259/g.234543  ORF Transcript_74259/g.234543 Transcript_74259/m.234543 type:complete len:313 (+) Transcript_74259:437-1375(+)